jgi:hypothetical protein
MMPTDALPAAEFLMRHLYRSIDVADGKRFVAIAANESPGGDKWYWNDYNAKIIGASVATGGWRHFPYETAEILRFVRSTCRGPYIFRRLSAPRLEPSGKEGTVSGYLRSLMRLKFDLPRGAVVAGVRFHDERTQDNLG